MFDGYDEFDLSGHNSWVLIEHCREVLGDNDILQPYLERPWFTHYNRLYVKKDIGGTPMTTYILLRQRHASN